MIQLRQRSGYSIGNAYGTFEEILGVNTAKNVFASALTDRGSTWGHVRWRKECNRRGIKPIYGVELFVVEDMHEREKLGGNYVTLLAKNTDGLKEIYDAVTVATEMFYYEPRIDYEFLEGMSSDVVKLIPFDYSGDKPLDSCFCLYGPESNFRREQTRTYPSIAVSNNRYPSYQDRPAWETIASPFNRDRRTTPQHLLCREEWELATGESFDTYDASPLAAMLDAEIPMAKMVKPKVDKTLRQMCVEGADIRNIDLSDPVYQDRLDRELDLIEKKSFEDYFFVVADLVKEAKKTMPVGPGRGSSCGSIVCYLLDITDVDPISWGLLFERFIDINRNDYPDIDIDFPDNQRDEVFAYLKSKYGNEYVSKIGTITTLKPKNCLLDVCRSFGVHRGVADSFQEAIDLCEQKEKVLKHIFENDGKAKAFLDRNPDYHIASKLEGHVRQSSTHAAGILVTDKPLSNYCSTDYRDSVAMIDKVDAEDLGMLKIDALALNTLAIFKDCLEKVGWSYSQLLEYPLDDKEVFDVINNKRMSKVFQFEGSTLRDLCSSVHIDHIDDLVAITSLARPGPLISGETARWVQRKNGGCYSVIPALEPYTKETYGVVVYQEQVMNIAREVGHMSWARVSALRKAIAKSKGDEAVAGFQKEFINGATRKSGLSKDEADKIWDTMKTMGKYSFNKSHAVAYSLVSYFCMILKCKFPLEYAWACLRNEKNDDKIKTLLREISKEGYKFVKCDKKNSEKNWSIHNGRLLGGLTSIKGIGDKMADRIIEKRETSKELTPHEDKLLTHGVTAFDNIFETQEKWGHITENPLDYNIASQIFETCDIEKDKYQEFVIIAKITEFTNRDLNEAHLVEKRGYEINGNTKFAMMTVEDDAGTSKVMIGKDEFYDMTTIHRLQDSVGEWVLIKGISEEGFGTIKLLRVKKLKGSKKYESVSR